MLLWWDGIKISVTWTSWYASLACVIAWQISIPPKRLRWKGLTLPAHKWGSHLSAVNSFYRSLTLVFNCLGYKSKWKVARNDCKPLWEKWKSSKHKMMEIVWLTQCASRKICVIYLWVRLLERERLHLQLSPKKWVLQETAMSEMYWIIQVKTQHFYL